MRRLGIDPAVGGNQFTQDGCFVERDPIHPTSPAYAILGGHSAALGKVERRNPVPSGDQLYNAYGFPAASPVMKTDTMGLTPDDSFGYENEKRPGAWLFVDSIPTKGIQGGVVGVGVMMTRAGLLRLDYARAARELERLGVSKETMSVLRTQLQQEFAVTGDQLFDAWTRHVTAVREATGHVKRYNNPTVTNAALNLKAKIACGVGSALTVAAVTVDIVDIAAAPSEERWYKAAYVGGRWTGALLGAELGAAGCAWGGPWGVGICGFVGGVAGGIFAEEAIRGLLPLPAPGFHGGGGQFSGGGASGGWSDSQATEAPVFPPGVSFHGGGGQFAGVGASGSW
jgi:uncharacterized membrane protein YgcG